MGESLKVAVSGGTPGANSNTYTLFDSTVCFSGGLRSHCLSRLSFGVENSQAGTLKLYMSVDRGLNWYQVGGDEAVSAAAATDISGPYDYLIDTYDDVKLDWVNGGSAQATWVPILTLVRGDRASGT